MGEGGVMVVVEPVAVVMAAALPGVAFPGVVEMEAMWVVEVLVVVVMAAAATERASLVASTGKGVTETVVTAVVMMAGAEAAMVAAAREEVLEAQTADTARNSQSCTRLS